MNNDGETNFQENEWSWNKAANMLYLEMPAGVGYSYADPGVSTDTNDTLTSEDNLRAFLDWFKKFPEFQKHDLFISGESYAGVYVPYMAWQMLKHNNMTTDGGFKFNVKGMIIGNGVTNWEWDGDTAYLDGAFPRSLAPINF